MRNTYIKAKENFSCIAGSILWLARLDKAAECLWLLIIFIIPLYFNLYLRDSCLFAKTQLFQFMVLVLLGITIARWMVTKTRVNSSLIASIRQSPLQVATFIFALAWIVSTVFSIMPYRSLWGSLAWQYGLSSVLCLMIFFLIIAQSVTTRIQINRILYTLLASSGLVCMIGIAQIVFPWLVPWGTINGRALSTIGNPLHLSAFIAMIMPLTLAMMILRWQGTKMRNINKTIFAGLILLFALQFVCLTMAQYSVTILVFVIGLFIFFGLLGLYLKRNSTLTLSILSILIIALTAVILIGQMLLPAGNMLPNSQQDVQVSAAEQVGLSTLGIRVAIWKCATDAFIDPTVIRIDGDSITSLRWLTGYGPETFMVVSQSTFPAELKSQYTSISLLLAQPENHYLYLLVTTGALGMIAFLCLLGIFFFLGFGLLSRTRERQTILIVAAVVAAVVQYCAHIFFDPSQIVPEMVFWLMLALLVAMVRLEGAGKSNRQLHTQELPGKRDGADRQVGGMRKVTAVLLMLLSIATGAALFFPACSANMKIKQSMNQNDEDRYQAMTLMTDAIVLQPDEAYYYGLLGYYAYSHALTEQDKAEKSRLLAVSTAAYESCTRLEPYLAYWHFALADNYLYRAQHNSADRLNDALKSYKEADALFPENSVILNKLALALMQEGDYKDADRMLTKSEEADSKWVQTTYSRGLLEVYQHCYCTAANCFVYPIRAELANLNPFMGFCKQLSLYGGINKVTEGLKVYTGCHRDEWLGFALLGIADVYGGNIKHGKAAFLNAAGRVSDNDAILLSKIVSVMVEENKGFESSATDVQARLALLIEE